MNIKNFLGIMGIAIAVFLVSCRKYDSLGYKPGTGAPTITSIHSWSQNSTAVNYDTITTYDNAGNVHDTVQTGPTQILPVDSVTTVGGLGNYVIIYGTNLGSATAVYFNGNNAYFNRALSTDQSIIVQIPTNTPYRKPAATDTVTIVTQHGQVSTYFMVLPPPPSVTTPSDYNFIAGSTDTLHGLAFDSVTTVWIQGLSSSPSSAGITLPCNIVSILSDTTMIIQFPQTATGLTQGNLKFAYIINGESDTTVDTKVFNDLDNAYQILGPKMTADPTQNWAAVFQNNGSYTGWVANGWSGWSASTSVVQGIAGISFYGQFDNGGFKVAGFQWNSGIAGSTPALAYDPSYQYLSFWVLNTGASVAQTAYIEWGNAGFANGGANKINAITIQPGGSWQYFKIPISSLLWNTGTTPWSGNASQQLTIVGFFLTAQNPTTGDGIGEADLYFTDVVLIKQ